MLSPAFVFAFNKRSTANFNRASIMDKLEGQVSEEVLRDALIRNIESKERSLKQNVTNSSQTVDLIKQQKEELENLERLEEQKKQKAIEEKKRIEREVIYIIYSTMRRKRKRKNFPSSSRKRLNHYQLNQVKITQILLTLYLDILMAVDALKDASLKVTKFKYSFII
jgi:hypothetical protein